MNEKKMRRVAVVGGGAGGLAAAIAAGRALAAVTIYEKQNRVGKKLLKTGNGRCNLTNLAVSPADYNHSDFVAGILAQTDSAALLDFFSSLGLSTVADSEGRVYPRSDTASSVLDVLRLGCAAAGVRENCSAEVCAVEREGALYRLYFADGRYEEAERVILATGGGTAIATGLGHRSVPFTPILCPLKTDTAPIRGLSGLRVRARVSLLRRGKTIFTEEGEVLFRDYGVSGIVILNASRFARPGDCLSLDLLPEETEEALSARLASRPFGGEELLTGIFHRRVNEALVRCAKNGSPSALAETIKAFRLTVQGIGDAAGAQVTRGGADVSEFDPLTLESRLCPGIYMIGEALDIDGRCGGFNLHWAFASGLAAGRSAAL